MLWRLKRKEFEAQKGEMNKKELKTLIDQGDIPGIIAFYQEEPVAWMAIQPREAYPALERSRVLKRVDDRPVWSVTCFFIRKDYRNMGVSSMLLEHAKTYAGKRGATLLEGYPISPKKDKMPDVFAWTGLERSFVRAGFQEVARRSDTRPIMRCELK
jgi:GNAT superfamily N-acetyltransferase